MITEKQKKFDYKSMNLMADANSYSNEYKGGSFKISQENLDQINYNSLVDSYTCENETDVKKYTQELEKAHRYDLIDQFNRFKAEYDAEKQKKLDKPFLDAICQIIDLTKINPDLIPYLLNIEKRLQSLEVLSGK